MYFCQLLIKIVSQVARATFQSTDCMAVTKSYACYRKQNILVSTPAGRKIARRRLKILRFLSPRCIRKRTSLKDLKHLSGLNFQIPSRTLRKGLCFKK